MDYTVDIDGLAGLDKNLQRTTENIDKATKRLKDEGPDKIGPDDLDSACSDFRSDWETGLDKLKDVIKGVRKNLDACIKEYAEAEEDISKNLAKAAKDAKGAHLGGKH